MLDWALRCASFLVRTLPPSLSYRLADLSGDMLYLFQVRGILSQDVPALTQAVWDSLQGLAGDHPDQWYAFRPIWAES